MSTVKASTRRIESIDALRGFALWGILVVNIFVFHAPYAHYFEFYFSTAGPETDLLEQTIFFFGGKFMFIFAFLFGYGAWMQYEKYQDKAAFQAFWQRRMLWLAFLGILHILFLSMGDILLAYALLGLTLPFVLGLRDRILWGLFFLIHLIPIYEFTLRQIWDYPGIFTTSTYSLEEYLRVHRTGSWWEIFQFRLYDFRGFLLEKSIMYIPKEWSLFVLGILASRRDLARRLSLQAGLLFCGITLAYLLVWFFYEAPIREWFNHQGAPLRAFPLGLLIISRESLHGLLYIIAFWLLWRWSFFQNFFAWLRSVGRMSLSNYILQSFVCTTLFNSYGLGWYGSCTTSELLGLTCLIFMAQLIFSHWWLQYYQFGPLEGWWRKRSYK